MLRGNERRGLPALVVFVGTSFQAANARERLRSASPIGSTSRGLRDSFFFREQSGRRVSRRCPPGRACPRPLGGVVALPPSGDALWQRTNVCTESPQPPRPLWPSPVSGCAGGLRRRASPCYGLPTLSL
jgi:hypothetical protein